MGYCCRDYVVSYILSISRQIGTFFTHRLSKDIVPHSYKDKVTSFKTMHFELSPKLCPMLTAFLLNIILSNVKWFLIALDNICWDHM